MWPTIIHYRLVIVRVSLIMVFRIHLLICTVYQGSRIEVGKKDFNISGNFSLTSRCQGLNLCSILSTECGRSQQDSVLYLTKK